MSAAKMVADSTQGDVPEMAGTKKRKKVVQKKKVKKKKESAKKGKKRSLQEEEFDESDLDLDREVYPIGYYVKDRKNLLDQMLHCVRGQSLSRALPDVLQELPLEDLRKRCMEQLEVMSKKRIQRILAGDDPASISSSGTEDDTSEEEAQDKEEGEYEGMDTQVVDSTSYTLETADSDRDVDYEEGSIGHSDQSPYPSDEEAEHQQQYEDGEEDAYGSDEDVRMEDDIQAENEQEDVPGEPEEPEEGEVFDDHSDREEVNNDNSEETEVRKESDDVVKANEKETLGEAGVSECKKTEEEGVEKANVETTDDAEDSKAIEESEGTGLLDDIKNTTNANENDEKDKASEETQSDDKSIEVKTDCDTRKVKTKTTEEETKQEEVKCDPEETESSEDHVLTVEADHVIDEEAVIIETEHGEEDISDEGEVLEKEKTLEKADNSIVEVKKAKQPRRIVKPPSQDIAPALTRNQMELLELEMRARAIKAMLKTAK